MACRKKKRPGASYGYGRAAAVDANQRIWGVLSSLEPVLACFETGRYNRGGSLDRVEDVEGHSVAEGRGRRCGGTNTYRRCAREHPGCDDRSSPGPRRTAAPPRGLA